MEAPLAQAAAEASGPGTDNEIQQPFTLVMPIDFERVDQLRATLQSPTVTAITEAALDKVGTVHGTRFVMLQDDEQRWAKLLVVAIYDGTLEAYIEAFAREMTLVFNKLLEFAVETEDKPPLPVEDHVEALIEYVRNRDVKPPSGRSYSSYPDVTALDIYEALRPHRDVAPPRQR